MFVVVDRWSQSRGGHLRFSVIAPTSPRSEIACKFVAEVFREAYQATINPRPDAYVFCERNTENGDVPLACAGLTFGFLRERLFSEQYLDDTIQDVLGGAGKHRVERAEIVEIGSLASRHTAAAAGLICALPIIAWFLGMRAILCTTTAVLRKLLDHHRIPFVALTEARPARLPEDERKRWGGYYENSPLTGIILLQECGHLFSNHCGRFAFANLAGPDLGSVLQSTARQENVA